MKITMETSLNNFDFWGGAEDSAAMLTYAQLEQVENELEGLYNDGITETELNDLFRFEFAYICELIGLEYDEENDIIIDGNEEE